MKAKAHENKQLPFSIDRTSSTSLTEFADSWNTPGWETGVPVVDPCGPATNCATRVARGGHYSSFIRDCRAAARFGCNPESGAQYCGYRLAVPIP